MTQRTTVLFAAMMVLLCIAALWSCRRMAVSRASASAARADLAVCRRMAADIEAVRKRPAMAADYERLSTETTGLIERAAKAAGVPAEGLVRISPEPAQRIGDTAYKEKPTLVILKNITLRQLVTLVHPLEAGDTCLRARSIRVTAPRPDDTGPQWNAELVLTYLIYDPLLAERQGAP